MSQTQLIKDELKQAFEKLDLDRNGKLSSQEMEKLAQQTGNYISKQDIENIFENLNQDEVNFVDFIFWYEYVKVNKLQKLYSIKKQIDKKLQEIKAKILQKNYLSNGHQTTQSQFGASITNGSNNKEFLIGIKLCTQLEAIKQTNALRDKLNIKDQIAIIFKIKVSTNINEAKQKLEDLIEQAKLIIENLILEKYEELNILSLVDINVEVEDKYLLVSIKSPNEIIKQMFQSFINLIKELRMIDKDQSNVLEIKYTSKIDLENIVKDKNTSVIMEILKGLIIDIKINVSSFILDNYRAVTYQTINEELKKSNNNELTPKKAKEYGLFVISSILSGISIKLNVQKLQEILPSNIIQLSFEQILQQLKLPIIIKQFIKLPFFQDLNKFFNDNTESELNISILYPDILIDFFLQTKNLSSVLNKILTF